MRAGKGILSFVLLVLLIGLRLLAPERAAQLRQSAAGLLNGTENYGEMIQTMGRRLSDGGLREGVVEVFSWAGLPLERGPEEETDTEAAADEPCAAADPAEGGP